MKVVITLIFPFFATIVIAQSAKKENLDPNKSNFKEFILKAQRIAPAEIKLPFSGIKIVDSRYDTSKFGFLPISNLYYGELRDFKKIKFEGGVAKPLEEYYNDYYKNSFQQNGFELLIVMKRFWVSGIDYSRNGHINVTNSLGLTSSLYCKWEYYLGKEGKYLPVKRVDTIMQVGEATATYIDEEFHERRLARLKFSLKAMIELYDFEKQVQIFDQRPKKTMQEISIFNSKRNDVIVLRDSVIKKGVYLSFDEFKNNKPSIEDFKEEKMKYKMFRSEKYLTNLEGTPISDYWGYSDGKVFRYGKFGNDRMFRIGNTFEFCVEVNIVYADNSTPISTKRNSRTWYPYQIDMETGEIY